jgi:hypothetical protein
MNKSKEEPKKSLDNEDLVEAYLDEAEWAERIQASDKPDVIIQKNPKTT